MIRLDCRQHSNWLERALEALELHGCCVVEGVLHSQLLEELRSAMYRAQERITIEVGRERLERAGEIGILRLMLKFEPVFFRLLELPEVLALIDKTLSPTGVLHLQNGFIVPSLDAGATPKLFQNSLHRDFPRYLNGYLASVNTFFAIDCFRANNGGTILLPGSHQRAVTPSAVFSESNGQAVECEAGAMVVFDSTLWHAAGINVSGRDRLGINQQFTRPWIKQQIDYVRALGDESIRAQPPRTQQLLGWYTRVVTSLDEYYQAEDQRLYLRGQG